jgi:hypothetical protein
MGLLGLITGALVAALSLTGRRIGAGEYVGQDHPAGRLLLRLDPGGAFVLRLDVWDSVVGTAVSERELTGTWRRTWRGLQLKAPARVITYSGVPERGEGWVWERSSLPTFADGITLVRAGQTVG